MDKKIGFGCMRWPLLDKDDQTSFDYKTFNKLVDAFLEKGFTYVDTAYTYHGYRAEEAVREALVKRYNKDEYTLATKRPMRDVPSTEECERL